MTVEAPDEQLGRPAPGNGRPVELTLAGGECFNDVESEDGAKIFRSDCAEPHDAEVFAAVRHPAGSDVPWIGDGELANFAMQKCLDLFEGFTASPFATSRFRIAVMRPTEATWTAGDRRIRCSLYDDGGNRLTGSVAGLGE